MSNYWRGIFAIVVTPFTDELELDEAALRRQIGFCIEAGAAGLVGPANAGEFAAMSDEERQRWIRIVVEEADGRVPVVAATTHGHRVPAVALSRYAQDVRRRRHYGYAAPHPAPGRRRLLRLLPGT